MKNVHFCTTNTGLFIWGLEQRLCVIFGQIYIFYKALLSWVGTWSSAIQKGFLHVAGSRQAAEGVPYSLSLSLPFSRAVFPKTPVRTLVWVLYPLSGLITVVKGLGHGSSRHRSIWPPCNKYLQTNIWKTNGETEKGLLGYADKNSSRQFNNYRGCYDYD